MLSYIISLNYNILCQTIKALGDTQKPRGLPCCIKGKSPDHINASCKRDISTAWGVNVHSALNLKPPPYLLPSIGSDLFFFVDISKSL